MTDTSVIFEELPQSRSRGGRPSRHWAIADLLKSRPKEWARIHVSRTRSGADSVAHQVSVGIIKAYCPPRTFEGKARTIDGEFRVYARYVGDGGETA